jgi:hypothetical protein
MSQFFVPDVESMRRCEWSRNHTKTVAVSGVDFMDGRVRLYRGIVQSVEDNGGGAPDGRRWRVTMRDAD